MRVLQVNKFHYLQGGAERYYRDLSLALSGRGWQVDHLSMSHPRNWPAGPHDLFVRRVDYRGKLGLGQKLREAGRTIYNREAASLAGRLAASGPPAVAHLHNIYHQLSPSIILAFSRAGVPMVQTLHDYKLVCPAYLLLTGGEICERCRGGRFYEAVRHRCLLASRGASAVAAAEAYVHAWLRTYSRVGRFLCPSRFLLEKVASFGIPRERLVHLPYFLPLERYRCAQPGEAGGAAGASGASAGGAGAGGGGADVPPTCVYVGRLSREKGIRTLIEAVAALPAGRLRLLVVGEGPLRADLEELAGARCPDRRIRFAGYREGDELHQTIRSASFAIVPSEWYENLPYAILETFALGRPVVGAQIGGIGELVEDRITGALFSSGATESLVHALLWMTGPEADVESMGLCARRRIEQEHSEEEHVRRLASVYESVRPAVTPPVGPAVTPPVSPADTPPVSPSAGTGVSA